MKNVIACISLAVFAAGSLPSAAQASDAKERETIARIVDVAIRPVMAEQDIPGMAVGVTVGGASYIFNYGVAAKGSNQKVDDQTIFEVGSISKTFTGTLASYAMAGNTFSLADSASKFLPELAGSAFDGISLLTLATYTAGGLPLQFPDGVKTHKDMVAYFKNWRPAHPPGTQRVYSNPSIGLFGYLAARSMKQPFDRLMEKTLLPGLGLTQTYLNVPANRSKQYAFGTAKTGPRSRVTPGILGSEAYGIKTTAADLLRFVRLNMDSRTLEERFRRAIDGTHIGYFRIEGMTQALGWEMYPYPADLDRLIAGNSTQISMKANAATRLDPPMAPDRTMLINKTGSTNGFGAYAAFIPSRNIGIVILANRNYPNGERVRIAHRILTAIDR